MIKIRKGNKSDRNNFLKVQKQAFPNLDIKKQEKYFNFKVKNKEIFIVRLNKEYLGHLSFGHYLLNPPFAKSIFLEEMAVGKIFRGKGVGKLLMEYIEKYCKSKKIPMIYLGTGDYNGNKAIKLYKKLGYSKIGKLKDINPKSEYKYSQIIFGKVIK